MLASQALGLIFPRLTQETTALAPMISRRLMDLSPFEKSYHAQNLPFIAEHPTCLVAMEACAGAHHWGREIGKLGHDVRLIAPQYVKPFVKRQKNDAADAEAIAEAASRPTMRYVGVKTHRHVARQSG